MSIRAVDASNSNPGPSLATGMLSDTANSGGEHEEVTAQSIEQKRDCIECETGTSPGACGTERGKVGAPNSESRELAESVDLDHNAIGGVLIPSMVAEQSWELEAREMSAASTRASTSPALLVPVEPAAVEVGFGQAPEVFSELTPSCDVRAAAAAEINVSGDSSPMHDEGTWEQRRALTNGDSLVLEPTLTGRGPCDSGALNFDVEVSALESEWARGLMREFFARKNSSTFRMVADNSIDVLCSLSAFSVMSFL